MMRWRMRVLALAGLVSACAAPLPAAPSAAAGPPVMGPVNILMGDGFAADPRRQAELDYVRGQIEASGVFAPAPPGAARPPVTLVVDYQQGDISLAQSAGAVAAAATMFLVPHQETVDFTLHVSFLTAGTAVPPRSYTATYAKTIAFIGHGQLDEDEKGLDLVLAKMFADLREHPPLPPV